TTYTFTPSQGLCATTATVSVTVNANITPTFGSFGPYCVDAQPGTLPSTSDNGITGTWSPAVISTASPGTIIYTFTPSQGLCATTATLDILTNPAVITDLGSLVICNGDSIIIGNKVFKNSQTISETLSTSNGCDSIVNLELTVLDPIITTLNERFCKGGSIQIGDSIYTKTGTYFNTFTSVADCDSLVILNLIVDSIAETDLSLEICNGDSVIIGNQVFKVTDIYRVVLPGSNNCDSIIILDLTVRDAIATTNVSKRICSGDAFTVGNETFNETGEYTITLESALGCDSTVLLNLIVDELPAIDAVTDKPTVNPGEQVQLGVTTTEQLSYNWTPANILSDPSIQNPTAILTESTWFVVTATNGQTRCSFTDSVFVELRELACSKENVFIPNAFTPNGDEVNDIFIPRSSILKSMKLVIVDRWGNQVFESNDLSIGWDGIYKGQPATEDSYGYYFIGECSRGEKITIKGNVTLLR
ncbi:MAG TPA: gliding motility-associated C-terminal domain-containing protein, partial [Chitinophagales bacterium]|nr:gliding motility-associated C-terminal domain-containing protein [Chitinophagales bacterium]